MNSILRLLITCVGLCVFHYIVLPLAFELSVALLVVFGGGLWIGITSFELVFVLFSLAIVYMTVPSVISALIIQIVIWYYTQYETKIYGILMLIIAFSVNILGIANLFRAVSYISIQEEGLFFVVLLIFEFLLFFVIANGIGIVEKNKKQDKYAQS